MRWLVCCAFALWCFTSFVACVCFKIEVRTDSRDIWISFILINNSPCCSSSRARFLLWSFWVVWACSTSICRSWWINCCPIVTPVADWKIFQRREVFTRRIYGVLLHRDSNERCSTWTRCQALTSRFLMLVRSCVSSWSFARKLRSVAWSMVRSSVAKSSFKTLASRSAFTRGISLRRNSWAFFSCVPEHMQRKIDSFQLFFASTMENRPSCSISTMESPRLTFSSSSSICRAAVCRCRICSWNPSLSPSVSMQWTKLYYLLRGRSQEIIVDLHQKSAHENSASCWSDWVI